MQIYKAGQGRYTRIGTAVGVACVILILACYAGSVVERQWPKQPNLVQAEWQGPGLPRQAIGESSLSGLTVSYYEGSWGDKVPDFASLKTKSTQTVKKLSSVEVALPDRFGDFALRFSGKLMVPKDGAYTVYLTSECPSRLYVDGKPAVENEGQKEGEKSASIDLTVGPHEVALECVHTFGFMAFIYAIKVFAIYGFPAVLAVVLVVVAVLLLNKPSFVDFLIATESEMKKVSWSSRAELLGSTTVVIVTVFLMALVIWVVDMVFVAMLTRVLHLW